MNTNLTMTQTYGVNFRIDRQGFVVIHRNGEDHKLGITRSRVFLAAVVLATLSAIEDPATERRVAQIMERLTCLVIGSLEGSTMRRVFDTLHILKLAVGDTDVNHDELFDRLLKAA